MSTQPIVHALLTLALVTGMPMTGWAGTSTTEAPKPALTPEPMADESFEGQVKALVTHLFALDAPAGDGRSRKNEFVPGTTALIMQAWKDGRWGVSAKNVGKAVSGKNNVSVSQIIDDTPVTTLASFTTERFHSDSRHTLHRLRIQTDPLPTRRESQQSLVGIPHGTLTQSAVDADTIKMFGVYINPPPKPPRPPLGQRVRQSMTRIWQSINQRLRGTTAVPSPTRATTRKGGG